MQVSELHYKCICPCATNLAIDSVNTVNLHLFHGESNLIHVNGLFTFWGHRYPQTAVKYLVAQDLQSPMGDPVTVLNMKLNTISYTLKE